MATEQEKKEYTLEQSEAQAALLITLFQTAILLDVDHLKACLEDLSNKHRSNLSIGALLDPAGFQGRDTELGAKCDRLKAVINLVETLNRTQVELMKAHEGDQKRAELMRQLGL